ncbi:Na+/H+-dicarboxylate symporter [Brevundimonas vesicularis]|jgi:Na+/H+-dicarboxylate symporter|uniref:Dicarboxylate/amino acid:cation symporter n=1 Tax=Brevundimonas vesicularis TaxID=41276 RepID=A0A1Z3UCK7_BREVE|nr:MULTISPECIES: dicarboxylate/amino acid:cation symporter [Brevundimonas]ASE40985.1 dicarboxylate/amino acid:cation symporter [Brevundimonas vesicularis]MDQ1192721.1 Na+/H+-dicarboxylate symporter [Brevundimonas vesicularis]MDX2335174.1 dicarboxylate/amino acid:cation symporter [Brevundimonas vesicularis]MRL67429.1 cation:dicarboxylase symporter family transporter [Brevundimonas sp. SPF441]WBT05076.1 dicarboxylate/amino acid:cation symporter [Brevundimonas vesicularis]
MTETKRGGLALHWLMLIGFAVGLIGGLLVNLTLGADTAWVVWLTDNVTGPLGQIFLRLLFMMVIPLLFSALVVGVAEMGDLSSLGRAGIKTLLLTILVSSIAVVIGLVMVNVFQPGRGVDPVLAQQLLDQGRDGAAGIVSGAPETIQLGDFFLDLIPSNVFTAASENQILPVMVFALFFGIGLVMAKSPATDRLQQVIEGMFEVTMKLINLFIKLAPIAIACLMFNLAALFGWDLLVRLAAYVGVAVGAMAIHMFVVYPLVIWILGGRSPIAFFKGVREPMVVAFSTASSNASLPVSLKAAEQELKLPRKIARFVLTVGATANQNGTALFEGVTVLFLAQFFGIDLTITQQIIVMLVCILGGIGTAGVPAGSLPVVAMILVMVKVPPEGIGLILGVDRFLDMCRTTLNVTGDLVLATVVSRGEEDEPIDADDVVPVAPPA